MSAPEWALVFAALFVLGMLFGYFAGLQSKRPPKPRKHAHEWGKWERIKTVRIWDNVRMLEGFIGYRYFYERQCATCGQDQHEIKEVTE